MAARYIYSVDSWILTLEICTLPLPALSSQGIMCQLIGDLTGFRTLAPYNKEVHALGALQYQGASGSDAAPAMTDDEIIVGWINRMASGR